MLIFGVSNTVRIPRSIITSVSSIDPSSGDLIEFLLIIIQEITLSYMLLALTSTVNIFRSVSIID